MNKQLKQVKFSKNQIALLQQMFDNANKVYDENQKEKPQLYNQHGRYSYIYGYVESFIELLVENGFAYLEK